MNNLVRLIHTSEYDRKDLMTKETYRKTPKLDEISLILDSAVLEVDSESGAGVHLGYFFTNVFDKKNPAGQKAITICFSPLHEKVKYILQENGDFWLKMDTKSIEIADFYYKHQREDTIHHPRTKKGLYINRVILYKYPLDI